jgi:RNA polymerase sigma factor (sigma-70 family)
VTPWLSDALLRAQTDERLAGLARAGHERAFVAIVERYRKPLLAFARRIAPEGRAEDIVQQALTSAWAALAAGAEIAHLRGWLHQIVRHEALRVAQREGRDVHDPLDPRGVVDVRALDAELEDRLRVREAFAGIAGLPARQREALVRIAVEGRSRSEVAAALGLSEGAVRQLVHRARATLRAAATAITPLPLASWAAAAAGGGGNAGLVEAVAGAGGATAAGTLLKAGAVVVATGALATGVTLSGHERRPAPPRTASHPTHAVPLRVADVVPEAATAPRAERSSPLRRSAPAAARRRGGGHRPNAPAMGRQRHEDSRPERHGDARTPAPERGGGEQRSGSSGDGASTETQPAGSGSEDLSTVTTTSGSNEGSGSGSTGDGSGSSGESSGPGSGDALPTTTDGGGDG